MPGNLSECWLKLDRAKTHRDALKSFIGKICANDANRFRLGIKFERDTGDHVLYINNSPDLSDELNKASLIAGDAINNLRSALDYLVYQLAVLNTNENVVKPRRTQFPMCQTRAKFQNAEKSELAEVDPSHRRIIEKFQLYHRIDEMYSVGTYFHPLEFLDNISNMDKHRLLSPVVIPTTGTSWGSMEYMMLYVASTVGRPLTIQPAGLNVEIARLHTDSEMRYSESENAGFVFPSIAFSDGHRNAVNVINKITRVVEKVVSKFQPFFDE